MFELKRTVMYSDVSRNLSLDMAGIVNYLQDCVLAHSESIGKGVDQVEKDKRAWFLSSWQIEVIRFPVYKEEVTVRTWPHEFKGMYGYRNFDIIDSDGTQIVKANSIWIFMDTEKGSPLKPTELDMKGYDLESALPMDYAPRKIKLLSQDHRIIGGSDNTDYVDVEIKVKRSFIDSNHHVNNDRYVVEALDFAGCEDVHKMRVDYRKAAVLGDVMYPVAYRDDTLMQIALNDADGSPYVIVELQR